MEGSGGSQQCVQELLEDELLEELLEDELLEELELLDELLLELLDELLDELLLELDELPEELELLEELLLELLGLELEELLELEGQPELELEPDCGLELLSVLPTKMAIVELQISKMRRHWGATEITGAGASASSTWGTSQAWLLRYAFASVASKASWSDLGRGGSRPRPHQSRVGARH